MKKFLSLLAIALVFASCNNDDDTVAQEDATIVGTFVLTDLNSPFIDDFNGDGTVSSNLLVEAPCLENTITFTEDGNYTSVGTSLNIDLTDNTVDCDGPFTANGTYTLTGNMLSVNETDTTDPEDVALTIEDGTVVITNAGITLTAQSPFGETVFVYSRQ